MEKEFLGFVCGRYENNCNNPSLISQYQYLVDTNTGWNDFGYITRSWLNLIKNEKIIHIGGIRLSNFGQVGETEPFVFPNSNLHYSFISNIESAVMIKLMVPKEDLSKLLLKLNVLFEVDSVKSERAYKKSILRDTTEEKFIAMQKQIKEIIYSDIDFHASLDFFKDSFKEYFK